MRNIDSTDSIAVIIIRHPNISLLLGDDRADENAQLELPRNGVDEDGIHQREQAPEPITNYVTRRLYTTFCHDDSLSVTYSRRTNDRRVNLLDWLKVVWGISRQQRPLVAFISELVGNIYTNCLIQRMMDRFNVVLKKREGSSTLMISLSWWRRIPGTTMSALFDYYIVMSRHSRYCRTPYPPFDRRDVWRSSIISYIPSTNEHPRWTIPEELNLSSKRNLEAKKGTSHEYYDVRRRNISVDSSVKVTGSRPLNVVFMQTFV